MTNDRNETLLNQDKGYHVTEIYQPIKTQELINQFNQRGFSVTSQVITKPRKIDKEGYQKHMIRLSHPDLLFKDTNERPEIVLVNSYDGSQALRIMLGVFRIVCSNGLIAGDSFRSASIRHTGDVWTKVDQGIKDVTNSLPQLISNIETMKQLKPNDTQINQLIEEAKTLALPDQINVTDYSVNSLTRLRRYAGNSNDLWSLFNRLQENIIKGGIRYKYSNLLDNGQVISKINSTRAIKSIDRQVEVNRSLWDSATKLIA